MTEQEPQKQQQNVPSGIMMQPHIISLPALHCMLSAEVKWMQCLCVSPERGEKGRLPSSRK